MISKENYTQAQVCGMPVTTIAWVTVCVTVNSKCIIAWVSVSVTVNSKCIIAWVIVCHSEQQVHHCMGQCRQKGICTH